MTQRPWRTVVLATVAIAFVWAAAPATATNQIAEAENVACTVCHDKPGSKLYTDKGKYWEMMRTFDGYDEIVVSFQECTNCHARKPGSTKLTRQGRQMSDLVGGMPELLEWLRERHPGLSETGDSEHQGDMESSEPPSAAVPLKE